MRVKKWLDLLVTGAIGIAALSVTWQSWREPRTVTETGPPQPPAYEDISASGMRTSIDGAPRTGSEGAPVVLIEYSDFECPFCRRHASDTFDLIRDEFIAKGSVLYVFRNYPIEEIHPTAVKAAHAGRCAHEQGRFMDMRTQLFTNQKTLRELDMVQAASQIGLESDRFAACLAAAGTSNFQDEKREAARLGVSSTPVFLLGRRGRHGDVALDLRLTGARPFTLFKEQIEGLLKRHTGTRGSKGVNLISESAVRTMVAQ